MKIYAEGVLLTIGVVGIVCVVGFTFAPYIDQALKPQRELIPDAVYCGKANRLTHLIKGCDSMAGCVIQQGTIAKRDEWLKYCIPSEVEE